MNQESLSPKENDTFSTNERDFEEMERDETIEFLSSIFSIDLEGNLEREGVENYLVKRGKNAFLAYLDIYTEKDSLNRLVLKSDVNLKRIWQDISFDQELKKAFINHILQFRLGLDKTIQKCLKEWSEKESWNGIISDSGIDYTKLESIKKSELENIWRDYDLYFPLPLASMIADNYCLNPYSFSENLASISYAYAMAKDGRKLLDHLFIDKVSCPFKESENTRKWNFERHMVGNDILLLDYFNQIISGGLEYDVSLLLSRYDIDPLRIGFKSNEQAYA